ncbi:MAG: DnaA regulatory inactivator Hda [Burkholderiales bacterium]
MEQLTFALAAPEPPSFENFIVGPNGEAVARLRLAARGELAERVVLLWGAPGAGRSHLLRAVVGAAARPALYCPGPAAAPAEPPDPGALVAVDDVGQADAAAQGRLFTLFNALQESGGLLVAAADVPPARLPLRDDLRSRLGWGLVYELLPLADADKPAALAAHARERGFRLPDEVIAYLLAHGRRDMASLVATLSALDAYSLAAKRPITLPLVREWLQRPLPS